MDVKQKRNIALLGHAHCGKTSLAESLLFVAGSVNRKGDVMKGTSVSDYNDDERERSISINASFLNISYSSHQIQIIDTPGYADFVGETISALRAADGAVVVIDAANGVEVGTEDVWQRLENLKIPRIVFINKIEKDGVSLEETLKDIREQLSSKAQVIDFHSSDLVEAVAESDDALLEKYLESGELSQDEVKGALRKAVLECKIFPVLQGTALQDKGTKELLDAIVSYMPNPTEHMPFKLYDPESEEQKTISPGVDGPFAGFIFKSMFDPHLGNICLMRVVRGSIEGNANCYNSTQKSKEHIGSIAILQGKDQSSVAKANCGDIVALSKLKNTFSSDTLCDDKERVVFPRVAYPDPSISASIKPKTRADEEKITSSLHKLCEEDRTFKMSRNAETKELIISGVGDLHLKVMIERMKARYNVEVDLGRPKVTYRETITKTAAARYKHKKQSGGRGQYGDVELEVSPCPMEGEEQYVFESKIFGGAIPRNYIPSVEKGAKKTIKEGVLAGYPIYNIKVVCIDGSYHDVDSSDMAFQIAAAMAMKEAFKKAGPVLLEPIMEVAITVSGDFIGQISGDLSSRRGRILGTEAKGKKDVVKANVPLSEMFSYASDLRSMTGGRGSYAMKFAHYEQAPSKIAEKVIAESQAAAASA